MIILAKQVPADFQSVGRVVIKRLREELLHLHVRFVTHNIQQRIQLLCRAEGIPPALESSHAIFHANQLAATLDSNQIVMVNLSGRGDKDMGIVADELGVEL